VSDGVDIAVGLLPFNGPRRRSEQRNHGRSRRERCYQPTSAQLFVLAINTLPSAFKARAVLDRVVD
jgi:hypothetical protein